MGRSSKFRRTWPARWSTSLDSIGEEKHLPRDTPSVPTIVITPPPSPNVSTGHQARSDETSWPIPEPNPFYLQPSHYLHPLHHGYPIESRHRSLVRRHCGWWTLTAIFCLLIISSSLHDMYIIHLSEARTRDESAYGPARQEPDKGARISDPVGNHSSFIISRVELPRLLDWSARGSA